MQSILFTKSGVTSWGYTWELILWKDRAFRKYVSSLSSETLEQKFARNTLLKLLTNKILSYILQK